MKKFLYLILFFCVSLQSMSLADDTNINIDLEDNIVVVEDTYSDDFSSLISSGKNACKICLFELAKNFFSQAFDTCNISNEQKKMAAIGFIDACLSTGSFSELASKFEKFSQLSSSDSSFLIKHRFFLRLAIASCLQNDFLFANRVILKIDIKALDDCELPWYYVAKSIVRAMSGNIEDSLNLFEEAKKHTIFSDQNAQIQAFFIQFILQLHHSPSEINALLFQLESLCENYKFQNVGYPFVKAYALLLSKVGNIERANAILDFHLAHVSPNNVQEIQSLHLHKAIVSGFQSQEDYSLIINILLSSASDELKKQALKNLVFFANTIQRRYEALKCLSDANLETVPNVLFRQILFTKMRLAVETGNISVAQQIAGEITIKFPEDHLLKDIYNALAYLAWKQIPKDYRMVAHYLKSMHDLVDGKTEKVLINIKIGNALYLAGAYDIAVEIYKEILQTCLPEIHYDKILCQLIQSEIKLNNLNAAQNHLLEFRNTHNSLTEYRWIGELMYINAAINGANGEQAEEYLATFLDIYAGQIPAFFAIKFYFLQSQLMLLKHSYQRAHLLASKICEMFPEKVTAFEISQIVAQAMFIKGACEFKSQNISAGRETFSKLRKLFVSHEVAMLSYFEEAEFYFGQQNINKANEVLLQLAEMNCQYSPLAYYKIAEFYKSLGVGSYDDAISYLSILLAKYKNHEIVYAARLEIADLLRLSGRFSDAELVYEELLKDFPFDKRYHFTEFCLAKAIFAQKHKGALSSERAQIILERLQSVGTLDKSLRIEIAAMYCFVLSSNGYLDGMKKVAWEFLLKNVANGAELSVNNIYWLLQITHILNQYYENKPDLKEKDVVEKEALREIESKLANAFSQTLPN